MEEEEEESANVRKNWIRIFWMGTDGWCDGSFVIQPWLASRSKEIEFWVPECPPREREKGKRLICEVVMSLVKPLYKWLPCSAHLLPSMSSKIVSGKA